MSTITTNILATNKNNFYQNVTEAILPTIMEKLVSLPFHSRLVTGLEIGVLRLKINDKWCPYLILDGVAEIVDNNLKIISRQVESFRY